MKYLTVALVLRLHERAIAVSGGDPGIRDLGLIESAVAQPRMTFGGESLYPTLVEKAAALAFSLIQNHGFVDGNKRVGYAAMSMFLYRNGYEVGGSVDERERVVLAVASGSMGRGEFVEWLGEHVAKKPFGSS